MGDKDNFSKNAAGPIVVALGGNAISRAGEEGNIAQQFVHSMETASCISELVEEGYHPIITHGNGPQIGNILRRVELSVNEVYPLPLHVCVADSQAGMGYMITQCLTNALRARGLSRQAATLITRVIVDPDDPAMSRPTKPIGRFIPLPQAEIFEERYGWHMRDFGSQGKRRVVASPQPLAIVEMELIRNLVAAGEIMVVAGGGGVPVFNNSQGEEQGVECVIDKDRTSALLGVELGASHLIIATGVEHVAINFGTTHEKILRQTTVEEMSRYLTDGQFPEGTMGPKIEAAIWFLSHSTAPDAEVIITDLPNMVRALRGETGTRIRRN